ncbi:MAG: HD domain-containing protein [Eubacterium sp.]|nr:HD domain-containing protein [Eubacterium sp.]
MCTNPEIIKIVYQYGSDILDSPKFDREKEFIQHGNTTTHHHSLAVAYVSVYLALKKEEKSKKKIDMRSLVRGALLHDYFLYDWHDKSENHSVHGYTHARQSLKNAKRDFPINKTEADIIFCHMFPLNITRFPRTREGRIVCIADKLCAGAETASLAHFVNYEYRLITLRNNAY